MDRGSFEGMTEVQTRTPIQAIVNEGVDKFTNTEDILAREKYLQLKLSKYAS